VPAFNNRNAHLVCNTLPSLSRETQQQHSACAIVLRTVLINRHSGRIRIFHRRRITESINALCSVVCFTYLYSKSKVKFFPEPQGLMVRRWFPFPQPDTSRSRKTMDTGLVHHVVCPFTPQFLLVLVNRPRRDGTMSWRWYTAATGGIRTHDLPYRTTVPHGHPALKHRVAVFEKEKIKYEWRKTAIKIKSNQIILFQASWPIANRQTDTHKQLMSCHVM